MEPSCGSASSLVIPVSLRYVGEVEISGSLSWHCCPELPSLPVGWGVALPGVDQGEDTLGGLWSYVNIDAMPFDQRWYDAPVEPLKCLHEASANACARKEKVFVCE